MQVKAENLQAGMKINFWVNEGKGVVVDKILPYHGPFDFIIGVAVLRWVNAKGEHRVTEASIEKGSAYTLMQ